VDHPSEVARYELSYDFDVLSSSVTYAALGTFAFFGTDYSSYPGVGLYGNELGATPDPNASPPRVTTNVLGTWHHVVTTVDRASGYRPVVAIDGMPVGAPVATEVGTTIVVSIQVGAFFTGPQEGAVKIVYDNVVVRTFSP
jgi:hypothetical protein